MVNKPKQTAEESFYEQIDQTNPVTRGSTALVKISKLTSAQTAVEWLESKMSTAFKELTINKELFQQAKEMEKKQIVDAYCLGHVFHDTNDSDSPEEYYKTEYGKQ